MNSQHLPATIRKWMGDSVGHWEGDTLVVDTTNFTDKTRFRGSTDSCTSSSGSTRVDAKTLLYRFTVEDPDTWAPAVDRRIHVAGDRRRRCTNTRATKATTRWATSCAARASGKRTKPTSGAGTGKIDSLVGMERRLDANEGCLRVGSASDRSSLPAMPLVAHHAFGGEFDPNRPVLLKGTVGKVEVGQPARVDSHRRHRSDGRR